MTFIEEIEVRMAPDGTYTLQVFRERDRTSPERTVTNAESIPAGLRALADEIERSGLAASGAPYPPARP